MSRFRQTLHIVVEVAHAQRFAAFVVSVGVGGGRVGERAFQCADRHVALLRNEHHARIDRRVDRAVAERPKSGERTHQGALARSGRTAYQPARTGLDRDIADLRERGAVRQGERQAFGGELILVDEVQVDAAMSGGRRSAFFQMRRMDDAFEFAQTIYRGAPIDKAAVTVDEPGERIAHCAERVLDLHQHAERECAGEVPRSGDRDRKDNRDLAVEAQHEAQALGVLHHSPPVVANALEDISRSGPFGCFPIVKRDLFGVFAHPDQAETEICLNLLLLVGDRNERMAELVDHVRATQRIERGDPYHVAGNDERDAAERDAQRAGQPPEDGDERNERDDRGQQVERQRERAGRK